MKILLVLIISQALVQCFETKSSSRNDGISPIFDAMQKWRNREAKITQESINPKQSRVTVDDLMNKRPSSLVQSKSQIKAKHSQSITNTVQSQTSPKQKQTLDKFIPSQEPIIKKAEPQIQSIPNNKQEFQEVNISKVSNQQIPQQQQQQKQNQNFNTQQQQQQQQQTNNVIQKNKTSQPIKNAIPNNLLNLRSGFHNTGPITGQSNGKLSFMSHLIGNG